MSLDKSARASAALSGESITPAEPDRITVDKMPLMVAACWMSEETAELVSAILANDAEGALDAVLDADGIVTLTIQSVGAQAASLALNNYLEAQARRNRKKGPHTAILVLAAGSAESTGASGAASGILASYARTLFPEDENYRADRRARFRTLFGEMGERVLGIAPRPWMVS